MNLAISEREWPFQDHIFKQRNKFAWSSATSSRHPNADKLDCRHSEKIHYGKTRTGIVYRRNRLRKSTSLAALIDYRNAMLRSYHHHWRPMNIYIHTKDLWSTNESWSWYHDYEDALKKPCVRHPIYSDRWNPIQETMEHPWLLQKQSFMLSTLHANNSIRRSTEYQLLPKSAAINYYWIVA